MVSPIRIYVWIPYGIRILDMVCITHVYPDVMRISVCELSTLRIERLSVQVDANANRLQLDLSLVVKS